MAWQHFAHEADMGLRGIATTKSGAFEEAAVALTATVTDPLRVRTDTEIHIEVEAPDDELLLAEWLNALIYEMATRKMLFGLFKVVLNPGKLEATVWGEPVDVNKHEPAVEVKGATYTALSVHQTNDGSWIAQCVVDV